MKKEKGEIRMKIYNTKSRTLETFQPLEPKKVNMYTCGPTVYNYIHIGNARMNVFFDVVRRIFEYLEYEVTFVQNVTDVDDRIIQEAKEQNISEMEIANTYYKKYNEDLQSLRVKTPTVQPRVTEHMNEIIAMITTLIEKGHAYEVNGDVYFRVMSFPTYGSLTNQTVDSLQSTERDVVIVEEKENPHDFALWKSQKGNEIAWESPWSKGRPGWHIECSAMSMKYLNESFDIHGGGLDLCFPHHENEIAQSEAYSGKTFATYWMHNNYVTVEGQKMSKSVGNFTTVRDALVDYTGDELRFFFLSVNYRNPIDYKKEALHQAKRSIEKIIEVKKKLQNVKQSGELSLHAKESVMKKQERFHHHLTNDFDTASVITLLLETVKEINIELDSEDSISTTDAITYLSFIETIGSVLGVEFHVSEQGELTKEELELIERRTLLKEKALQEIDKTVKVSYFQEADGIRNELLAKGIVLTDTKDGVAWERK